MNKQDYLYALRNGLDGLPENEINERISFYSDMIDDRVEEGMSEEEAINQIGSPEKVLEEILSDVSLVKIIKHKVKPKRRLRGWEIALIIIGSPLWFPLLVAAFAIVFALFVAVWAILGGLFSGDIALAIGGIAGFIGVGSQFVEGSFGGGLAIFGGSLASIGIALFLLVACIGLTKGLIKAIRAIILGIKKSLVRKDEK